MSRREGIQFAVGEPNGLRGSLYSVWFRETDIYISKIDLYEDWKASIHFGKPGIPYPVRYGGFSGPFAKKHGLSTRRRDRAGHEWPGMELLPGSDVILEFRLRIPQSEIRPLGTADLKPLNPGDPLDVHWLPAPPVGGASEVTIISAPPTHAGGQPRRDDFADRLIYERQLANGRFIWLAHHYIPAPADADLHAYREVVDRQLGDSKVKYRRFVALMDCEDGSAAFAEFVTNYGAEQFAASAV
jgi:hypothetical protein